MSPTCIGPCTENEQNLAALKQKNKNEQDRAHVRENTTGKEKLKTRSYLEVQIENHHIVFSHHDYFLQTQACN
jgi:hypothetical protein